MKAQFNKQSDTFYQISNKQQDCIVEHVAAIDGKMTSRKYYKKGLLGAGGFANCFIVENSQTKKRAAAKIISKELLASYRTKLRVMNEIKLHKTLHHSNIVEFYHYFEDKNNIYIFLELCENQSLSQLIKIRQYFTTPQIQAFIYGLIQGLIYLHSKLIIHRDLKLGNIFVNQNLNVKIGDFGLATKLQFQTQFKRTICGTPNYIAPQILQGKGYHFEVDIWSLGVIIYTLYVGSPPFETEQAAQTYKKIRNIDYLVPIKSQNIPQQAINLILSILVKNPVNRPTLEEILDSDFMRLGQGILSNLPKVCAIKAPSKKQLNQNTPISIHKSKTSIKRTHVRQNSQNNKHTNNTKTISKAKQAQYVIKVEHIQENNSYMYELNDNSKAVLTKDNNILYRNSNDKIIKFDITKKFENQSCQQNINNTNIVNSKSYIKTADEFHKSQKLYVQKITHYKIFYMIRLSNMTIQILFDTGDGFYITQPQQIFYFDKNQKIQCLDIKEIMNVSIQKFKQIQNHKIGYLRGILTQIKSRKPKRKYRESM